MRQAVAVKTRDQKTMVSASELSQMGACERLVLFEAKYGKRKSRCQREAIERGRRRGMVANVFRGCPR
jgi:hypothetical protein